MAALAAVLRDAAERLARVSETPRLDAELLLAHCLGVSRASLLARLNETRDTPGFEALLERRLAYEPLAYIFGSWEFYSLEFAVHAPILVPRPETEHTVECVLAGLPQGPSRVLDLCTGTGCIAVAIAKNAPGARVTATDLNPDAVALARNNAERHGVAIAVYEGDLFQALPADCAPFDAIVANPPYVEDAEWDTLSPTIRDHEDHGAIVSGPGGFELIQPIIEQAPRYLKPGGHVVIELGDTQSRHAAKLFDDAGYSDVGIINDLAGIERVVHARWEG